MGPGTPVLAVSAVAVPGRGDLLKDLQQGRNVPVEGLLAAQPRCFRRHGLAARILGHVVECRDQLALGVGRGEDVALAAVGHQLAGAVLGRGDDG